MNSLFKDRATYRIGGFFHHENDATLFQGDCLDLLRNIPDQSVQLVITSPPYNIGKEYEKRTQLQEYVEFQRKVLIECHRIIKPEGSICYQTGNYVRDGAIVPLDIALYPIFDELGMKMRNRIIWHFGHGLHASKRFSGRYETIVWFTKSDQYYFNLDAIRIPQKYPQKKHFKGGKKGELSGNPLGKNPSDVWDIPNVKNNHVEKTSHPCQFPVALVERLALSMTKESDLVVDPFIGAGSTAVAALLHNRRVAGADIEQKYLDIAKNRLDRLSQGVLQTRPMDMAVYQPKEAYQSQIFVEMENDLHLAIAR